MQWEYAMIVSTSFDPKSIMLKSNSFFSSPGRSENFDHASYLVLLDQFGKEGWEAYASHIRDVGNSLAGTGGLEYTFMLKRPVKDK